jgi:hypothetical protein
MELSSAFNHAVDAIVEVEFSRGDLGDLLDQYQQFLAELNHEGLYDSDDIEVVSQDASMFDQLLQLEKMFETKVTLNSIEGLTVPRIQVNPIIEHDFKGRLTEIIMVAPVRKYILAGDNVLKLLADEFGSAEGIIINRQALAGVLQKLLVGLYRRGYGTRVCQVVFGKALY